MLQYALLGFSLLTTGFFEETARFLGYRWFTEKTAKTWLLGMTCGIGHGGCESFGLGVAGVFSAVSNAAIVQPLWLPLVDLWVRLWAMCLQVALSLMVLRVFQWRQIRWLWIAIGIHVLVNLAGVMISRLVRDASTGSLVNALAVSFFGAFGLWYTLHLRMVETQSRAEPSVAAV